ncbi:MAG: septum formation family protein [Jatrophihabitans sp.]
MSLLARVRPRTIAANVGGVVLVLVILALPFGATRVRDSKHLLPGITTAADVPGTCHNDQDYFEVELTSAELTPAVPCTSRHTSEVVWTVALTGQVAAQHDRPTPEMLSGQYRKLCQQPRRLSAYVGEDPRGFLYNLALDIRYPSAPEWRAGVRIARCIAGPFYHAGLTRPTVNFALAGSWGGVESGAIRLCATDPNAYLPCDRPHTQEVLEPINVFPRTQITFPSPDLSRKLGQLPCTRQALDLLGRTALPASLSVIVEPAEPQNWPRHRDVGCRIQSAQRTGTLAAGLT